MTNLQCVRFTLFWHNIKYHIWLQISPLSAPWRRQWLRWGGQAPDQELLLDVPSQTWFLSRIQYWMIFAWHNGRYFGSPGKNICASALTQTEDKRYFQLVHNHHKLLAQLLHIHIDTCFQSFRNGGESWFPKKLIRGWVFLFTFHWQFWESPIYFTFSANSFSIIAFSQLNIFKRTVAQ